jgi:hypothetical protein
MSMITVELARALLGTRDRVPPRVDWDKIRAEYLQRSRAQAIAAATRTGSAIIADRVAHPERELYAQGSAQ